MTSQSFESDIDFIQSQTFANSAPTLRVHRHMKSRCRTSLFSGLNVIQIRFHENCTSKKRRPKQGISFFGGPGIHRKVLRDIVSHGLFASRSCKLGSQWQLPIGEAAAENYFNLPLCILAFVERPNPVGKQMGSTLLCSWKGLTLICSNKKSRVR